MPPRKTGLPGGDSAAGPRCSLAAASTQDAHLPRVLEHEHLVQECPERPELRDEPRLSWPPRPARCVEVWLRLSFSAIGIDRWNGDGIYGGAAESVNHRSGLLSFFHDLLSFLTTRRLSLMRLPSITDVRGTLHIQNTGRRLTGHPDAQSRAPRAHEMVSGHAPRAVHRRFMCIPSSSRNSDRAPRWGAVRPPGFP